MPDTADVQHSFDAVTEVHAGDDGRFLATVSPEWTIGGRPNGGYLLAMMGRAATAATPHDHVIAASAHFVRSPTDGPVVIATDLLRAGRSASQVRARLEQGGGACVETVFTVSHLDADTKPYWDGGLPLPPAVPFDDGVALATRSPSGVHVAMMDQVELRIDPASHGFAAGAPSGRGELSGWLSLRGHATFDPVSLLFAVDSFPPATFDVELTGWVPTLELTAYVRALPAPGPVRVLQRAHLVDAQRVDESCFVWDVTGRLVAQATQLAGIRLG